MPKVLQLVDSLALGGLERVAVDLANGLSKHPSCSQSSLCSTRAGGPLEQDLEERVQYLPIKRRSRWDLGAVAQCAHWAHRHGIEILHAHGSSLLFANLLLLRWPGPRKDRPRLIWHDHFGRYATEQRSKLLFKILTARADAILSVNEPLRQWAIEELGLRESSCVYVPNSVDMTKFPPLAQDAHASTRTITRDTPEPPLVIVCLANLRAQKDHKSVLEAFALIVAEHRGPSPKLHLIGSSPEPTTASALHTLVVQLKLEDHVEFLGERADVPELLAAADIGVLSSSSEGLPLALLEYGAASLPVVCTSVGQVPDVLGIGQHQTGLMVSPSSPRELADGLLRLLNSPRERSDFGQRLHDRVQSNFSQQATLDLVQSVYQRVVA